MQIEEKDPTPVHSFSCGLLRALSRKEDTTFPWVDRFRGKMEQLQRFEGLLRESQGQNQALTVSYVLYRGYFAHKETPPPRTLQ